MQNLNFAIIDTETTGTDPEVDTVVEIACIAPAEGEFFSTLINPDREIPPTASAVHHITDRDVMTAPKRAGAVADLVRRIGNAIPIAHNAGFDSKFLPELDRPWLCTYRLARHLWPDAPGHSNQVLRYWLKTDIKPDGDPHRAMADVQVTLANFERMVERCRELGIVTIEEMIALANKPILVDVMPFGKHKDVKFSEIPADYFEYMLGQPDLDADMKASMEAELVWREANPENAHDFQRPLPDTLSFGKHSGKKFAEIPVDYLQWVLDNNVCRDKRLQVALREHLSALPDSSVVSAPKTSGMIKSSRTGRGMKA